ncbi:MAG: hypothetical protein IT561_02220 [Alphaproteobacteria bacterium]|nr:hypothetical protein [Alphaproteobacteria bacterium]
MPRHAVLAVALLAAALPAGLAAADRTVATKWKAETRQVGPALLRTARTQGYLGAAVTITGPELLLSFECGDGTPPVLLVGVGTPAEPMPLLPDGRPPAQVAIAFEFRTVTPHWLNRAIGGTLGDELVPDVARNLDGVRTESRTVIGADAARRGASRVAAVRGDDMLALAELMKAHGAVTVHMGRNSTRFSLAGAATAMAASGCPTPLR